MPHLKIVEHLQKLMTGWVNFAEILKGPWLRLDDFRKRSIMLPYASETRAIRFLVREPSVALNSA